MPSNYRTCEIRPVIFSWQRLSSIFLTCCIFLCGVNQVIAKGYSSDQNKIIWANRLAANDVSFEDARIKCEWKNAPKPTFMDEDQENHIYKDQKLFLELMTLLRYDQNARAVYVALGNQSSREKAREVDAENLQRIKPVILNAFPDLKAVGYEGSNAALVLAIHADSDPVFQKEALAKVQEAAKRGDVPVNFPIIFQTVRSKVAGKSAATTSSPHAAAPSVETKEECFQREYSERFNEYLKLHLPPSIQS
jgi:hypothetical protein